MALFSRGVDAQGIVANSFTNKPRRSRALRRATQRYFRTCEHKAAAHEHKAAAQRRPECWRRQLGRGQRVEKITSMCWGRRPHRPYML
jgi:hypothetical protein